MNLNQAPQPHERVGMGNHISDLWNSRNRLSKILILATTGLILNCCCVIIPLLGKANSLPAQANVSVNAASSLVFTTAQDPFIPPALAISANTEFGNNSDGKVVCKNFNSQAAAQNTHRAVYIQLDGSDKDGRSCKSLP